MRKVVLAWIEKLYEPILYELPTTRGYDFLRAGLIDMGKNGGRGIEGSGTTTINTDR
eukprot:GSA25T00024114001.1